ncbi:MAG: homoserine dehydrogenase [Defluviitaleaceae bacterium]|nr:homoserine dehydrogenase [Defluviitaleaceae bacterium]
MRIAILGYGVVGSGVAEVLKINAAQVAKKAGESGESIDVKYILDTRDFPGEDQKSKFIKNFEEIERDPEIKIVAECIGGETTAYDFAKRAILAGKHVVTPNKALIAAHGAELFALAKERGVHLLFEASVGGGIPLIRPFCGALLTDEVQEIAGILNGTSNYILTQMNDNGKSYDNALKSAQELGYAEADPTADVGGFDACRKLSILLSLATGKTVDYKDIPTEGIEKITADDFAFAAENGYTLKHLAIAKISAGGVQAVVAPFLVKIGHPMSTVSDVYNALWARAKTTGSVMFYGSGAGKLPTASAVVSNLVDIAQNACAAHIWTAERVKILPAEGFAMKKTFRIYEG